MKTTPAVGRAQPAGLLAGCAQDEPPFDELPLRDALRADPAALASMSDGRRDGSAFAIFVAIYAIGRFVIEFLRGDPHRGHALGLSTAQWLSVAIVIGVSIRAWKLLRGTSAQCSTAAVTPAPNRAGAASNCA